MKSLQEEKEAFYEKQCLNGIYASDGDVYYDIEKEVTEYFLSVIATLEVSLEANLRESLAKKVAAMDNPYNAALNPIQFDIYEKCMYDAAREIRNDKASTPQ